MCGPDRDAGAMAAYPRCGHCAGLFKGGSLTATCPLHPECTIGLLHHNCVRRHMERFHRDEDKSPSPDDGRFPRNRAPPVDPEALSLRAASSAPSSSSATPPAASALSLAPSASSASDISVTFGGPYTHPSWLARRRGGSTGARPLQGTERLEDGGGLCCAGRVRTADHRIRKRGGLRGEALETRLLPRLHGHPLGQCTVERLQALGKGRVEGREGGGRDRGPRKGWGAPRRTRRRASLGLQTQGISALSLAQKKRQKKLDAAICGSSADVLIHTDNSAC